LKQFIIAEATSDDIDDFYAIEIQAHKSPWTYMMLKESLQGEHLCWKLFFDNQLVGYMIVMRVMEQLELLNIAIATNYQGKGLAHNLMSFLKNYAQENRVQTIFLEVRQSNSKAISLYQKYGFLEVGKRKNYYANADDREDALVMQTST